MPNEKGKNPLFDSSDSEVDDAQTCNLLNVENDYAKKYNDWRRKEELQKLKDKYGDNLDIPSEIEGDQSTEDDDQDASDEEDEESDFGNSSDEQFDEQFFKVYSALRKKDPKIYDKSFNIIENNYDETMKKSPKITKNDSQKLTLQQYHKKLIEEKKGITEEDELMLNNNLLENKPNGYYEELYNIRKEIKDIVNQNDNETDESDEDNFFSVKNDDQPHKKQVKFLSKVDKNQIISEIWNQKNLNKNDEFLKDFIVNKKYLLPETLHSDIKKVENRFGGFKNVTDSHLTGVNEEDDNEKVESDQAQLEIAKFHYEEPDANVIKRYPRGVVSIRDVKNNTKSHRSELRERKKKEKEVELKRLRKLKREEVESKIQKFKEISGNQSIDIKDLDLNIIIDDENEFDLEKYDQKMKLLFGDSYYNTCADSSKPSFEYIPEIDNDLYDEVIF